MDPARAGEGGLAVMDERRLRIQILAKYAMKMVEEAESLCGGMEKSDVAEVIFDDLQQAAARLSRVSRLE